MRLSLDTMSTEALTQHVAYELKPGLLSRHVAKGRKVLRSTGPAAVVDGDVMWNTRKASTGS